MGIDIDDIRKRHANSIRNTSTGRILGESLDEIERLRLYERAMQSMAAQFVHPKMTAEELAMSQLEKL